MKLFLPFSLMAHSPAFPLFLDFFFVFYGSFCTVLTSKCYPLSIFTETLTLTASSVTSSRFDCLISTSLVSICLLNTLPLSYFIISASTLKKKLFLRPQVDPSNAVSTSVIVISIHALDHRVGHSYFLPWASVPTEGLRQASGAHR